MIAIYKRELKSYTFTMIGSVFLAFLLAFVGIYFMVYNLNYGYNYFSYALGSGLLVMIVIVPILTMKSFAEERHNKSDQLLLTSPVSVTKIVLGKYLAMVSILGIACVIFMIFPVIIRMLGTAHFLIDYLTILMFFLIGSVYIAIGMFLSSTTESQIIAAVGTMAVLLLLYFWSTLTNYLPSGTLANLVMVLILFALVALALQSYLQNWTFTSLIYAVVALGTIIVYFVTKTSFESLLTNILSSFDLTAVLTDLVDSSLLNIPNVFLLLSLIVAFNYLTIQVIQKRRWS
ncbi:MAG: ABC transporter permease [Enterococcus italicus]|uniref:ABC transporter permease n=1 Tax=Enterococcus italicus TaxID=246144 RepID=UPI003F45E766